MRKEIGEITNRIKSQHTAIVNAIPKFPEKVLVGRCKNGKWAKVSYSDTGLGLACFAFAQDSEDWFEVPGKTPLRLVEMTKDEAIKIAKKEKLNYLHLLSNNIAEPLAHHKII